MATGLQPATKAGPRPTAKEQVQTHLHPIGRVRATALVRAPPSTPHESGNLGRAEWRAWGH